MLTAAFLGLIAAGVVVASGEIGAAFPRLSDPAALLVVAALIILVQRFSFDRWARKYSALRGYDGLADLMIHIHSPSHPDNAARWFLRSAVSALLMFAGVPVGPEGVAMEAVHASALQLRDSSSRWFEQRRRTDAAIALSGGIAAAFSAPFAGIMLPMEMGIGGRGLLSILSSFTAYIGVRFFTEMGLAKSLDLSGILGEFRFSDIREIAVAAAVALGGGILGAALIRFVDRLRRSLQLLFPSQSWMRTICAVVLMFLIALIFREGHGSPFSQLEQVYGAHRSLPEVGLTLLAQFLSFALVLSAFGTMGAFWPIFALGGLGGYFAGSVLGSSLGLAPSGDFPVFAGLVGSASLWSVLFGTPMTAAVLAFELTRNFHVLIPCFLGGLLAREIRTRLRTGPLVDWAMRARGMTLSEGRSVEILKTLSIKEIMVLDHEPVLEHEALTDLHRKLLDSRYQFLPVVNTQGEYRGLLTADMIQDAWEAQAELTEARPLARIFEAKDILYRVQFRAPVVKASDDLTVTSGLFREIPCVAVVSEDMKVQGLLFAHSVRLAYEREVARRSLAGVQHSDHERF